MFRSEYKEDDDFSSYKMRNLQLLDSDVDLVEWIMRLCTHQNSYGFIGATIYTLPSLVFQ
jgi:hypothetical protein